MPEALWSGDEPRAAVRVRAFRGRDLAAAFEAVRSALGEEVVIVRTRTAREGETPVTEVVAAPAAEVERLRRRLDAGPLPVAAPGARPPVLALVGPTGAGKTTTLAKLAVHPDAFGGRRVGVVTLDTYRAGAVEQLGVLAEIAGLPMEVVHSAAGVPGALARLAGCAAILVDTPGRGPLQAAGEPEWEAALNALAPDEVHLVLPAVVRADVARACCARFAALGATHLLISKLDEAPDEAGLAAMASWAGLAARWVTDGQSVPADLGPALPRVMASLDVDRTGWTS